MDTGYDTHDPQKHIVEFNASGSHDWWKNLKKCMGQNVNTTSVMQGLTNKTTIGDCGSLANTMNGFFVSVSEHLPRLDSDHEVLSVNEELPGQYVISRAGM